MKAINFYKIISEATKEDDKIALNKAKAKLKYMQDNNYPDYEIRKQLKIVDDLYERTTMLQRRFAYGMKHPDEMKKSAELKKRFSGNKEETLKSYQNSDKAKEIKNIKDKIQSVKDEIKSKKDTASKDEMIKLTNKLDMLRGELSAAAKKDAHENSMDAITLDRLEQIVKANTETKEEKIGDIKKKEAVGDYGSKTQAILSAKDRAYKNIVDFINFCSGVGINGNALERQLPKPDKEETETEKGYRSKIGEEPNPMGQRYIENPKWPEESEFNKLKDKTLKSIQTLDSYEVLLNDNYKKIAKELERLVERVEYKELDFDTLEKDMNGRYRYNADVFDDLFPCLKSLRLPKNFLQAVAGLQGDSVLKKAIDAGIVGDQLSDVEKNKEERAKIMSKALDSDNENDYTKARKAEMGLDNISAAGEKRNEAYAASKGSSEEEIRKAKAEARKEYDAARFASKSLTGAKSTGDFLTDNCVDKLSMKKVEAIIDKWIKEGATKDDKHRIIVYGSINGRSEQGLLAFVPGATSAYGDKALTIDGAPAFKLVKNFFTSLTSERSAFIDDKRKDVSFKAQVNEKLKKASVFNY